MLRFRRNPFIWDHLVLKSQHPTIPSISLIPCAGWVENMCLAYHVILFSTDCSWNILSACWPAGFGGFAVWFSFCLFVSFSVGVLAGRIITTSKIAISSLERHFAAQVVRNNSSQGRRPCPALPSQPASQPASRIRVDQIPRSSGTPSRSHEKMCSHSSPPVHTPGSCLPAPTNRICAMDDSAAWLLK